MAKSAIAALEMATQNVYDQVHNVRFYSKDTPPPSGCVYVFASSKSGRCGSGTTHHLAIHKFRACSSTNKGPSGQAYALLLKDEFGHTLPDDETKQSMRALKLYINSSKQRCFHIADFIDEIDPETFKLIAPMFKGLRNLRLPLRFAKFIRE